jgi:hypothetical protein
LLEIFKMLLYSVFMFLTESQQARLIMLQREKIFINAVKVFYKSLINNNPINFNPLFFSIEIYSAIPQEKMRYSALWSVCESIRIELLFSQTESLENFKNILDDFIEEYKEVEGLDYKW